MAPLVLGEILGVRFNTLTDNGKYIFQDCENLPLPNEMQLSEKKKKLFLTFLFHFSNLDQILNIFKQKIMVVTNVFPKLKTGKNLLGPFSKKRRFRTRFDSQHVKASQILAKSPWKRFYHVVYHSQPSSSRECLSWC